MTTEMASRAPLRESSTNRQVAPRVISPSKASAAAVARERESKSLAGSALRDWQRQWRKIIATHVVYFDSLDQSSIDRYKPILEGLKTRTSAFFDKEVTLVVTSRKPDQKFHAQDVLSKAQKMGLKIWTMEKLYRFLTNLLGKVPFGQTGGERKLANVLNRERHSGPSDRDPTAKRDDMVYFKEEYLLVYDYLHRYKPTIIKDYELKDVDEIRWWPQFAITGGNHCPFAHDTPKHKQAKVQKMREAKREEEGTEATEAEQEGDQNEQEKADGHGATTASMTDEQDNENEGEGDHEQQNMVEVQECDQNALGDEQEVQEEQEVVEVMNNDQHEGEADVQEHQPEMRKQSDHSNHLKRKRELTEYGPTKKMAGIDNVAKRLFFNELHASGINRSTSTSATRSVIQQEPVPNYLSQYASREVQAVPGTTLQPGSRLSATAKPTLNVNTNRNPLATIAADNRQHHNNAQSRHHSALPQQVQQPSKQSKEKPAKKQDPAGAAGGGDEAWCENCRETFKDFKAHVTSKKHVEFANDDSNFAKLDRLLAKIQRV